MVAARVQDNRQPGYFWADNEVVDCHLINIGMHGFAVYMLLTRYANAATGECDPSIPTMAKALGVSEPTIKKALNTLAKHGLITVKRRQDKENKKRNYTNLYTILHIPKVVKEDTQVGKDVTHPGQPDCPPLGNHVAPNNTKKNKTQRTKEIPPAQSADEKPPTNDSSPADFFVKQNGVAIQADSYADAQRIAEKGGTITQRQALKDELIEKNKQGLLFQAWVEELGKDTLPAAFAYKPYMRFMLQLVKDGYEPPDLTCAASLYKAWLKAHPGRVSVDWAVGAVTTAIRRALDLCKSGICAEDVSAFVTARYAETDNRGNRFWAGKLVKFDHVAENVANWKAELAPPTDESGERWVTVEKEIEPGVFKRTLEKAS